MKRKIYISGILILIIVAIFLFFPEFLLPPLFKSLDFPLGTLITWIGFVSFNSFFYYQYRRMITSQTSLTNILRMCFKFLLITSYVWGFLGYVLAANWTMTFSGSSISFRGSYNASLYYWGIIYILTISPIILFVVTLIMKKLRRI